MPEGPRLIRVVVLRHGPAEVRDPARWPSDDRRPLTTKGIAQTRRAVRGLARNLEQVDHLVTSAAARARRTAELLRAALDLPPKVTTWAELGTGHLAGPVFERIRRSVRSRETVVLVGHEPTLAEFVGLALVGEGVPAVRLTKAGAVLIEFATTVRPGAGRLLWALTRKQLADVRG